MNRVIFTNGTSNKAQVSVVINSGMSNFQIEPGASDDVTRAAEGETLEFWWRNDGMPCRNCEQAAPPCSRNSFAMSAQDKAVRLGDPQWMKQTA